MLVRNRPPMRKKIKANVWKDVLTDSRGLLAGNVREPRGERHLSQENLAFEAGVDRTLVSKIEREVANPGLLVLSKICAVLDVPIARLFQERRAE